MICVNLVFRKGRKNWRKGKILLKLINLISCFILSLFVTNQTSKNYIWIKNDQWEWEKNKKQSLIKMRIRINYQGHVQELIIRGVYKNLLSKWGLKELSLFHKIKYSNANIFATWWCKPLIFQIKIIWSNRITSLKYLRSTTLDCSNIRIRKPEILAKPQLICFLWWNPSVVNIYVNEPMGGDGT